MSMTTNGPRILIASVEARTAALEKGLARANQTLQRNMGSMETRTAQARRRIEGETSAMASKANSALASIGKSFAGGFLGGFAAGSIQGVVSEIRNATRGIAELSAEAKRAGVGVEAFQELSYAARQSGVSVDGLTDGMKELQLRADEFIVTGKGSGAEAFERLGFTAGELKSKLRDPAALFTDIIGRLNALNDTAASIRIADEIFGGTGGEQFVRFIEGGAAGLVKAREEARALGLVLDEDVVRKGVEVDRQFQKIADTIANNMKNAVVSVATSIADWSTGAEKFLTTLGNSSFFKKLNDWTSFNWSTTGDLTRTTPPTQASGGLDAKAADVLRRALVAAGDRAVTSVPDRTQQLPSRFVDPKLSGLRADFQANLAKLIVAAKDAGHDLKIGSGFRSIERQQELWAAAVAKYGSEDAARKWVAPPGRSFHNKGTAADLSYAGEGMTPNSSAGRAARQYAQANAARFGLSFPLGNEGWHVEPAGQRGAGALGDPDTSGVEKQAAKRTEAQVALDKQAEAVKRVVEALGLEAAQIGQTAEKQELLTRLAAAGVDVNSAEGRAIAEKVAALYKLKAAQDRVEQSSEAANRAREELSDLGASATKSIISDLRGGASAAEAFGNALGQIADRLISMAVDKLFANAFAAPTGGAAGGGGLGVLGFLGSLFGFASGGYTGPGGVNQPAGVVHRGEVVFSQADVARAGGVAVVEAMRRGRRGYAQGGVVDLNLPPLVPPTLQTASEALGGGTSNQTVNFAPQITVNGSAGTPEQNDALAKSIGREMELTMRTMAAREIQQQLRPGNLLNRAR